LLKFGIRPEDNRDFDPAVDSQHGSQGQISQGKKPVVIDDGGMFFKDMESRFLYPIGLTDLPNGANSELGGKTVRITDIPVTKMVEPYLPKCLLFMGNLRDRVTGFVKDLKSFNEGRRLFGCGKKFYFDGQFHEVDGRHGVSFCQPKNRKGDGFPPHPKGMGFPAVKIE